MEENRNCYAFEKHNFNKGDLDEIIDATYVIHLKDNGRYESILEQLNYYQPTKLVYIIINKGFKKCSKSDFIKIPSDDLIDANLQVLKHSQKMNYNNILVLEDDFIFDPKIKEPLHKKNLINFLNNNTNNPYVYLLGCVPMLLIPYNYYHYKPFLSGGMHSVIYNKKMIEIILSTKQTTISDWDEFGIWYNYKYTYYTPLCYQLFPVTENSKSWGGRNNFIISYIKQLGPIFLHSLNMDKSIEPGYSILYIFSKLLFVLIILIIHMFIY